MLQQWKIYIVDNGFFFCVKQLSTDKDNFSSCYQIKIHYYLWSKSHIFQCPNIESAEEWHKGVYEVHDTGKLTNEK